MTYRIAVDVEATENLATQERRQSAQSKQLPALDRCDEQSYGVLSISQTVQLSHVEERARLGTTKGNDFSSV